jgi:hypothetical protein
MRAIDRIPAFHRTSSFASLAAALLVGCATQHAQVGDVTDITDPARAGRPLGAACASTEVRYCQANGSKGEEGICTCMSPGAASDTLQSLDSSGL